MGDRSARTLWVSESRSLWPYCKNPYINWHSPIKKRKKKCERHFIGRYFQHCSLKNQNCCLEKVLLLSQKLLPETFNSVWISPSYICNARKPEKKNCSAFQVGDDSRKDTEKPQRRCLLSRSCHGMDRLHTYPWNSYQSQHPRQVCAHHFRDARADDEPAETSSSPGFAPSDMHRPQTSSLPTRQLQSCCCKGEQCRLQWAPVSFPGRDSPPVLWEEIGWEQTPVGNTIVTSSHNLHQHCDTVSYHT